ncbi:hypothetical protein AADW59_00785 [Candidatus Hodgkinia cicadicola]
MESWRDLWLSLRARARSNLNITYSFNFKRRTLSSTLAFNGLDKHFSNAAGVQHPNVVADTSL